MPESAPRTLRETLTTGPEAERLREELREFLRARATKAVTGLGTKLGEGVGRLGEGGAGGLTGPLAKGGKALKEGKSPAQALTSAGAAHLKDTVKDKIKGLFGKGKGGKGGGGKSKSVTIVEDIDVGVPVREAYDQWTQFQEFSTFAKGVVSVEAADDTTTNWKVKVAKSTRSMRANVTEQVPDERIQWTTEGAKGTVKGVVTFHPLGENLTRVLLVLEYFPHGLFEKTGNIWRAQGRRARLDLKLYRKFIMMRGEATDGWRGEIRDGEVVVDHEQALEDEAREDDSADEAAGPADGEDVDEDVDEPVDDEDAEGEPEDGYADEDGAEQDPDAEEPEDGLADEDAGAGPEEDEDLPEDEFDEDAEPEGEEYAEPEDVADEAEPEDVAADEVEPDEDAGYAGDDAEDAEDAESGEAEPEEAEAEEEPRRRSRRRPATARR